MQARIAHAPAEALPLAKERGPLVYVSDSAGNFVDVFNQNGTLLGRITDGLDYPADLFVDTNHNLYVANDGGGNVLKFKRGRTKAASTYRDVEDALAPTLCANRALYVAHGSIAVFAPGHHTPTGSLNDPYGVTDSVSCDKALNIFATATVLSPPGYVVEFPAGSTKAKLVLSNLPNPVDVKPDPAGNLLVVDAAGGSTNDVTEYTEAGSPTGKSMPTNGNWNEIAITSNGKELFGADQSALEGVLVKFPSGKVLQLYVDKNFKQLGGIAYDPG